MTKVFDVIGRVLWCGVGCGVASAVLYGIAMLTTEMSAPQQAAAAADVLVWTIVPYALARAWDEITRAPRWRAES